MLTWPMTSCDLGEGRDLDMFGPIIPEMVGERHSFTIKHLYEMAPVES